MPYVPTPRQQVCEYSAIHYDLDGLTMVEAAIMLTEMARTTPEAVFSYGDDLQRGGTNQKGLFVLTFRDETDEEMHARHQKEAEHHLFQEQQDAAEFARLSAKFAKS